MRKVASAHLRNGYASTSRMKRVPFGVKNDHLRTDNFADYPDIVGIGDLQKICKKCWASSAKRLLNMQSIRISTA